jgi:hypothetical protein
MLQFVDKHGNEIPIVRSMPDVPAEVKAAFAKKQRSGAHPAEERAEKLLEAALHHIGLHAVGTSEAWGHAYYKFSGEVLTKHKLLGGISYLVDIGKVIRHTRGYYQITDHSAHAADHGDAVTEHYNGETKEVKHNGKKRKD